MKRKPIANGRIPTEASRLKERVRELIKERNRLRRLNAAIKAERDDYLKALYKVMPWEKIEFDKKELFAQMGRRPSLEELVAELKAQVHSK